MSKMLNFLSNFKFWVTGNTAKLILCTVIYMVLLANVLFGLLYLIYNYTPLKSDVALGLISIPLFALGMYAYYKFFKSKKI